MRISKCTVHIQRLIIVEDDSPDGIFSSFTLSNTPDWTTTPGWLTASTAGGGSGACRVATAAEQAFLNSHTCSGSILLNAWMQIPTAITGTDELFAYGKGSDSDNYIIGITAARKFLCGYAGTTTPVGAVLTADTIYNVGVHWDFVNLKERVYIDGAAYSADTAITKLTGAPTNKLVGFLTAANGTEGAPATILEFAESDITTTGQPLVSDLIIVRFESDVSASFADIHAAFAAGVRGRIPDILYAL